MRILISGAGGFIGKPLVSYLTKKNHTIVTIRHEINHLGELDWSFDSGFFEYFDAVIHLAGEPLTISRWSKEKKEKILISRKEGTFALAKNLAGLQFVPKVFISASGIGYYGNRGEELLDEGSAPGKGFLAHVCKEWEAGCRPLKDLGTRTVQARFGMVLGPNGGALQKMLPLYRKGLGGKMGTGEQWISWIALPDLIHALDFLLHTDSLHGPVNIVSPHPIRQKAFSKALASHQHVPAWFRTPAWLLHLGLGDAADELLLASTRAVPQKLCSHGFKFLYPDLDSSLLDKIV